MIFSRQCSSRPCLCHMVCVFVLLIFLCRCSGYCLLIVCCSHGEIGARAAATPRKGKGSLSKMPQADQRRLSNRLERFDLGMRPPPSSSTRSGDDLAFQSKPMVDDNGMVDWAAITIKGTSTKLEKDYLRLTQVRPPQVSVLGLGCKYL